ncbi:hypothetical protein PVAP13_9KG632900 [Panicum virgatum]|uniref:Uncharacterized protein n=1 Tax=Panicum virgatum TaxID=38727 RepID=A0A8T0NWM4_PANVG|nr:hypothetical protein PVAP13_9KG632900 [Panicum virgatum]
MARQQLGKTLLKSARFRDLVEQSGELKGKNSGEKSGTAEKALHKVSEVNMLAEQCNEKKAASGGIVKFVTMVPRFKLRWGGKVYRVEFLLKRLKQIKLTMSGDL